MNLLTFTLHARGVQGETFGAFTVEAAGRVDTSGPVPTGAALSRALVVVCKEKRTFLY